MEKIKLYGNFDIREELDNFRSEVIKKHPNLSEEVKALEEYIGWDRKSKALALKEVILKIRIDPYELNSKYLIEKLDGILEANDE
jgi:hypothetical protein